ncbi:MAG: hypothetical protein KJ000_12650 [Pirellulaceae bacterium]|nr:hypothetical protein [Pirellulaceae bacterium]
MSNKPRHLVDHKFLGGRFEDHGMDLDVLPELLQYKRLVVELAKELWRRRNPDRERLPKNFEDSLALRFYEVRGNCVTIPLERAVAADSNIQLWQAEDELDDAVDLVADTIEAAGKDQTLPDAFPKQLLQLFGDYGRTLRDDEWIEHKLARRNVCVRYDKAVQRNLTRWLTGSYQDSIDVIGEVTMARVSRPRMALQLSDGREVEAAFRPEDEDLITTALKEHTTARLRIVGRGQFSASGQVDRIVDVEHMSLLADGSVGFDVSVKAIWDEFDEVLADVSDKDLSRLPVDAAERHDFYLHGQHEAET